MTREEQIQTLKAIIQECKEYQWQRRETLFEIIKDLEQETVSKEVYDHEYFLRKEFELKIAKLEQQEPKTGHWISRPHIYGVAFCSECGYELKINNTNYCPNCGAKMIELQESAG